jgi:hypothetical protein
LPKWPQKNGRSKKSFEFSFLDDDEDDDDSLCKSLCVGWVSQRKTLVYPKKKVFSPKNLFGHRHTHTHTRFGIYEYSKANPVILNDEAKDWKIIEQNNKLYRHQNSFF